MEADHAIFVAVDCFCLVHPARFAEQEHEGLILMVFELLCFRVKSSKLEVDIEKIETL